MKDFCSNVFAWLFIGLLVTFASGYAIYLSPSLLQLIFGSSLYFIFPIAQIVICIVLSARIMKMKPNTAKILYILYTILTGLTFSSIFLVFDLATIMYVFLITAVIFGIFALIGKTTKMNLSSIGTFLFMALIAIIILEVVNLFIMNNTIDMLACIIGIVIFMGYTAYDMQKIMKINNAGDGNDNLAIIGAFELYLDFINLFIKILRLLSRRRD